MKPLPILALLIITAFAAPGQSPLVGTWEMVSIKGTDALGKKFSNDTSAIREVKVITPTHYILIAFDVEGDSLVFNRTYFGKIKIDKGRYVEQPLASSLPIFENVKTDFKWKVDGNTFVQSGSITRPDGKKITLGELTFRKVTRDLSYSDSPINGTWKLISSNYTRADGTSHSDTNEHVTGYHVFTPTHWMYISMRDKKFEHVMGGGYTINNNQYNLHLDYSSFPKKLWGNTNVSHQLERNTLTLKGESVFTDGSKFLWEDVLERVE